jgi:hypothetical protein
MIICSAFPHDSRRIANIQHNLYHRALDFILGKARERYRDASAIVNVWPELWERVVTQNGIDHRTLQWFHDALAAQFRFKYVHEPDLFEDARYFTSEEQRIEKLWWFFMHDELDRLFDARPSAVRYVCTAAYYPNPDKAGIEAEEELYHLTLAEYPFLQPPGYM